MTAPKARREPAASSTREGVVVDGSGGELGGASAEQSSKRSSSTTREEGSRMTTTKTRANGRPAIAESVTIETAAVTIRVVHVADRPMTIAVYEQLPVDDWERPGDVPIGYIRRCRKCCAERGCRGWHVLAARDGEPVLLLLRKGALPDDVRSLDYEAREYTSELWEWRSNRLREWIAGEQAERETLSDPEYFPVPHEAGIAASLDRESELRAELARIVEREPIAQAANREREAWWSERIDPLPQLYIAR